MGEPAKNGGLKSSSPFCLPVSIRQWETANLCSKFSFLLTANNREVLFREVCAERWLHQRSDIMKGTEAKWNQLGGSDGKKQISKEPHNEDF